VGDPALESRILAAVIGAPFDEADFYRVGARTFNLQRAILLREGHRARDDDWLPDDWHDRGIDTHVADPDLLVPGPGGQVVSQLGRRIDRPSYDRLRDEYYARRGWDVPTGLPARRELADLGLNDVAHDLQARGLAVETARPAPLPTRTRHELHALQATLRERASTMLVRAKALLPALGARPSGPSIRGEELRAILVRQQGKFGLPAIRHNFAGWTKSMQYHFPDIDEHWVIRFVDGEAQAPERLDRPLPRPEISYEMDTSTLKAMSEGSLSGEEAYLRRRLRVKAPFADLMKLQSMNKV
jgi:hypothetical protein